MTLYHHILKNSYQRAVIPDYEGFFNRFYKILIAADDEVAKLFENTDVERQSKMLMQSMTYVMSFAHTLEAGENMEKLARLHGRDRLNISKEFYSIWTESLIQTVRERDPEFNSQVETAWRVVMAPGIEYMKSFCD